MDHTALISSLEKATAVVDLNLGGVRAAARTVNLRDLGFVGGVSEDARAEIDAAERRAAMVLQTAHLYLFGGRDA